MRYCPKCKKEFPDDQRFCTDDEDQHLFLTDKYRLVGNTFNDYRVDGLIAEGGMGAVYLAYQTNLKRHVAFKIPRPDCLLDEKVKIERFEREMELLGQLSHENIVIVHDSGVTDNGIPYIVMEWLEGQSLREEIINRRTLSLNHTLEIVRQVAAALTVVHTQEVVHRDLNPVNIFLHKQPGGREIVKLVDFGIGKVIEDISRPLKPNPNASQPEKSIPLGKPDYAPLEQFLNRNVTEKVDIYALGVTFYEMLTGELPLWHEDTAEMQVEHGAAMPPNVCALRPDVPQEVGDFILRMLAKTPRERPAAKEVKAFCQQLQLKLREEAARLTEGLKPRTITNPIPPTEGTTTVAKASGDMSGARRPRRKLIFTSATCLALLAVAIGWIVSSRLGVMSPDRAGTQPSLTPTPTAIPPAPSSQPATPQPPPAGTNPRTPVPTVTPDPSKTRLPQPLTQETVKTLVQKKFGPENIEFILDDKPTCYGKDCQQRVKVIGKESSTNKADTFKTVKFTWDGKQWQLAPDFN